MAAPVKVPVHRMILFSNPEPGSSAHLPLPGGGRGCRPQRPDPAAHKGRAGLPAGLRLAAELLRGDGGRHCDRARPGARAQLIPRLRLGWR
jgi:hypothetical protein